MDNLTNLTNLTPKQIAQTYVLNDIIVHEMILEALNQVEHLMMATDRALTKYDVIHKVASLVAKDELFDFFEIQANEVMKALKEEYNDEIADLLNRNNTSSS